MSARAASNIVAGKMKKWVVWDLVERITFAMIFASRELCFQ